MTSKKNEVIALVVKILMFTIFLPITLMTMLVMHVLDKDLLWRNPLGKWIEKNFL